MQSEKKHSLLLLTPDTSIDGTSAAEMIEQTRLALDDGCRDVILDLHAVPYIAAAGLQAMLDSAALLGKVGGHLVVAGLRGQTQAIMQVSGLSHMLLQFDNAADAEHYLQGMRPPHLASPSDDDDGEDDEEEEDEYDDERIFDDE